MWARLQAWARALRRDALTLWFCARDPRAPLAPRLIALALAAYAFSPIDLIPDFIPILGYVDEVILLPIGIWLCLRLVPAPLLAECRASADRWIEARKGKPVSLAGAAFIVLLWLVAAAWCWHAVVAD